MPISNGKATERGWEIVIGYRERSRFVVVVDEDRVIGGQALRYDDDAEELMVATEIGRYFPVGCTIYYVRLDGQQIIESRKLRDVGP